MKKFSIKGLVASAAIAVAVLGASAASAATYNLNLLGGVVNGTGGAKNYDATLIRATLGCSLECFGLDSSAVSATNVANPYPAPATSTATGFVSNYSDLFYMANHSEADERGFVNSATGSTFALNSGTKTSGNGAETASFTSNAMYILFTIGKSPDVTIVKNTGYGNTLTFAGLESLGSGLSHYVEFGEYECTGSDCDGGTGGPNPVPLPAGLPLLAAALGLGFFLRKRRT